MARQGLQEIHHRPVAGIDEEGVIPHIHHMGLGQGLDVGKIHHHAVGRVPILVDDAAGEGDFQHVAVPVQMAALTAVIGNAMAGIEFQAAGN